MTTARSYDELGEDEQVEVLRRVALEAAPAFGLEVDRMELLLHGFNTTFAVTTAAGRRVALRVNTNSLAEPEHLAAQLSWVHALATETGLRVPDPVPTTDGGSFASVRSAEVGRTFRMVVNTWLEGDDVEDCDEEQARALGRAMATMHRQARGWTLPPGTSLPRFTEPLLGDEDRLASVELPGEDGRAVVDEAMRRGRAAFDAVLAGEDAIPIHGDLHGGNLKWHDGRLALFDFDDSGLGVPALDLAVATFYLRHDDGTAAETALGEGYEEVRPRPAVDPETAEALVASRQLLLANSLLTSTTPQFRAMLPEYLERTVDRLRHWLDTGAFRLDPPSS